MALKEEVTSPEPGLGLSATSREATPGPESELGGHQRQRLAKLQEDGVGAPRVGALFCEGAFCFCMWVIYIF